MSAPSDSQLFGPFEQADADALCASVRFDEHGLVPAIAQDVLAGAVRMVGFMDREALTATLTTGFAHFHSRSRGRLWKKGETSGNVLAVRGVHLDCDGDSVLVLVDPAGPTCHTGTSSCFFRVAAPGSRGWESGVEPLAVAEQLEATLIQRKASDAARSYTRQLLDGGASLIGSKLREEADELARAIAGEPPERVASEAADVVYHLVVGLISRDVPWRSVLRELARRFGMGGLAEKASRSK